jgi:undecaprenyl diphosphate synthase
VAYGGRWDITQAVRGVAADVAAGLVQPDQIDDESIASRLALSGVPDPDLLIRTGGEKRISNFLLWNLAYSEFFFCDVLWPAFSVEHLDAAFAYFAARERRFGKTSAQIKAGANA